MAGRSDLIGKDGKPIRALTFAGGGFGTVLQLGVAHALLVSRGEAPDVVVGISAGSVNAVALAEILQAGEGASDKQRLARRVERFRAVFEEIQSAPTELLSALLPDSLQIDTHRPLEPLELPIHAQDERIQRDRALHSRSGLMNVYNELLALGLPIGTIARAARRFLGLKAIGEEKDFVVLIPKMIEESLPFLDMIGANLHRLAPLVRVVLPAAVAPEGKPPAGASAGALIFQARAWEWFTRAVCNLVSLMVLVVLWLVVTALAFVIVVAIGVFLLLVIAKRIAASARRRWQLGARIKSGFARARAEIAGHVVGFVRWLWDLSAIRRLRFHARLRLGRRRLRSRGRRAKGWLAALPARFASLLAHPKATRVLRSLGLRRVRVWLAKAAASQKVGTVRTWSGSLRQKLGAWRAAKLVKLGKIRRLDWAREWFESLHQKWTARLPAPKRKPDPARIWVAAWTWVRLLLTLLWRWLLWMAPVALLLALPIDRTFVVLALLVLLALGVAGAVLVYRNRSFLRRGFLRRNALESSLFDPHPLRQLLVRLFDPDYYGKLDMDKVVETAMVRSESARREPLQPRSLRRYAEATPPIHVKVAAANVETGEMETVPGRTPVVDALLAGLAVVPFFPAQKIGRTFYIDGTNIANEPTRPLLKFLRQRTPDAGSRPQPGDINPASSVVHMYPVSALPISTPELGPRDREDSSSSLHWPLVDVAERALDLQRFRDARLERQLTELYTRAMPQNDKLVYSAPPAYPGDLGKKYLRTWVYPIEPQRPVKVNNRMLRARSEDDRRRILAETVADGCRAALETMIQRDIRRSAGSRPVRCSKAVESRLAGQSSATLPGSDSNYGPGLVEVCRHCALARAEDGSAPKKKRCRLLARAPDQTPPPWPLEGKASEGPNDVQLKPPTNRQKEEAIEILKSYKEAGYKTDAMAKPTPWPSPDKQRKAPTARPTVSLLFSGGVFRGVYQLGVLNALSEVNLRPDVVAGASVGSITAAMAARVFAETRSNPRRARDLRVQRIRGLAATYMAIDRLVLTDRFSDFVRTMTVRAAQTRFSLQQADRVVRQYDRAGRGSYERQARIVLAGLERLLYVSPFEFRDLLEALRLRRSDRAFALIKDFFQELLDRGGVGEEVLGAEPLELLIVEHVLDGERSRDEPKSTPFEHFLDNGIFLLATATNLTRGRLEILGEHQLGGDRKRTSLIQGLLASSAFPGVFRPRWSWEVMPHAATQELFTDGGVMDNLPLDAVARFLAVAAQADLITARPTTADGPVPHLLFSASLQEDPARLSAREVEELAGDWGALKDRAKRLSYNQKLEIYERAQQAVRRIRESCGPPPPGCFEPLDLEVVTVRPRWLCGTFAFHPMLGFRRLQQARSIAHGCASTLVRLDAYRRIATRERWAGEDGWGLDLAGLPKLDRIKGRSTFDPLPPSANSPEGYCWFRPDRPCPFSRHSQQNADLDSKTLYELDRIHRECGLPETHAPGA